jgi:glutaredoxin
MRRTLLLMMVLALVLPGRAALAEPTDGAAHDADEDCVVEVGTCPVDLEDLELDDEPLDAGTADARPRAERVVLVLYWAEGCPHCEAAKRFLSSLSREHLALDVELVEVKRDGAGRRRFIDEMKRLGAGAVGVPTFVVGDAWITGFVEGSTEARVRALLERDGGAGTDALRRVDLPLVGSIDPTSISLPAFTLIIGLVDGINPCAMWVLLVLLGILMHVESRKRLLLFGGTFVIASGVVYFLFMTAWVGVFSLVGFSRLATVLLGIAVLGMGLVNLKEVVWFKKGVSLTIPDKAKPSLFRRMRAIASAASLPAAFLGIAVLAFFVNLIELGCTLGLPAIYTRILTLRSDLSPATRYGYLALYNLAYVVPLALIVGVYAVTLHRLALGERGAKVLKGVSGALLVLFGLLFIFAPDMLS